MGHVRFHARTILLTRRGVYARAGTCGFGRVDTQINHAGRAQPGSQLVEKWAEEKLHKGNNVTLSELAFLEDAIKALLYG